jgi:DNA helicase-2/ATP-dependent DNA helicase PcrA
MPLPEMVDMVLERSQLKQHYLTEKEGADRRKLGAAGQCGGLFVSEEGFGKDAPAFAGPRAENITVISSGDVQIVDAEAALPAVMSPLAAFLSHASLEAGDNQAQAGQDALQLMTVHSAKGLEFNNVFITGLEEGLFPHENSAQEEAGWKKSAA